MKCENIAQVRENIDRIDDAIIRLIAERGTYVTQASAFKKDTDGVRDTARVEQVILKVRQKAEAYGADPGMVERLYREMIAGFVSMELRAFENGKNGGGK